MPEPSTPIAPARVPLDPELEALPPPRRPWRRTTLLVLALTAAGSAALAWDLRSPALFSTLAGPPRDVGLLAAARLEAGLGNGWVRGEGLLGDRAAEYRRPLDRDRYRLAPVQGTERLWVQIRVPSDVEPERFVPPNSFVGRLVPFREAGLGEAALEEAATVALGRAPQRDAWVLLDGEAPATTRWAIGLVLLFAGFAGFSSWGFLRLLRPVSERP